MKNRELIVKLESVHKRYPLGSTEVLALQGVGFTLSRGDFISIAGPSGSGKSTILNLIGCIDTATEGNVMVLGKDTGSLDDEALTELRHRGIGFIFQSFNLVPVLTVLENIELPLLLERGSARKLTRIDREWIGHLVESVGLDGRTAHRPSELSGGQRQRVAIARALVMRPPLVLADEPTANLDSATGESIVTLMKRMNREMGTTFVFSTHDPGIVGIADHVIRLKDGLVVLDERKVQPDFVIPAGGGGAAGAAGGAGNSGTAGTSRLRGTGQVAAS